MKTAYTFVFLTVLSVLAGCAPSQEQFVSAREAVRGSEKMRQSALHDCVTKGWNKKNVQAAAMLLDTSEQNASRLACKRFLDAFKSGRLTYEDATAFKQSRMTPKLIRIFQGR